MPDPLIPPDDEAADSNTSPADDRLENLLLAHARPGACPPPDLLFAVEEDVLPPAARASIREHAAHCALCQTLLAEAAVPSQALSQGADARIRARIQSRIDEASSAAKNVASRRKSTLWLAFAAVAAVVIVGILGLVSYRGSRAPSNRATVAANHPPPQPAVLPPADFPELHRIAPLAPPDDVPALVTRGARTTHGPSVEDLMPAFRAYNRGDFAQAAAAFAPLAKRFPSSDIPPLYLGVSQLQLAQNAAAQRSLEQAYALTGASHHEAAAWYLAVADLRLGQPKAAAPLLRELCAQQESPYTSQACVLARRIGSE